MQENIDDLICDTDKCSGCHACYSVCPKQCIDMRADTEGFLQPCSDKSRCVNCGKCRMVCPINKKSVEGEQGKAFAAINTDDKIRMKSSSGGIFTLLAEHIINSGGVVFGAAFGKDLNVKHIMVETVQDLHKLRCSKYVQSRIGDAYIRTKKVLESGRQVLFTGTPCQIGGLKNFLGRDYENLIMQDIICHGVPSPMIWQKYLHYIKTTHGSDIDSDIVPVFRDKSSGWHRYSIKICLKNGMEYKQTLDKDLFMRAFIMSFSLRRSCYQCHFKSLKRESDLTLADFWGGEQQVPELCDNKGTSLVLIHSEKGAALFENLKIKKVEVDYKRATMPNIAAYKSVPMPEQRDNFIKEINTSDFDRTVKKYCRTKITVLIKRNIKSIGGKILRFVGLRK